MTRGPALAKGAACVQTCAGAAHGEPGLFNKEKQRMNSETLDDVGKLIFRMGFGVLFLMHGIHKIMNYPGSLEWISTRLVETGLPAEVAYGIFVGEVLAPILIIIGWHARIGAILTTITMVFAIYLAHAHELFDLTQHGGWQLELQGMFLLASVAIALSGPGRISLNGR
jgi:putative oxidoreductase